MLVGDNRAENHRFANDIRKNLESREINGARYGYDIDVEALTAVPNYSGEIADIVLGGIALYTTDDFETVQNMLVQGDLDDE